MKDKREPKPISMRVDPELWRKAKALAAMKGITLAELISDILKAKLAEGK